MFPGLILPKQAPRVFVTKFGEYPTGAIPAGWTQRWVTAGYTPSVELSTGSLSGKALKFTNTVANRKLLSWDRVPAFADLELLLRGRYVGTPSTAQDLFRPTARGSGAAAAESAYMAPIFYHASAANGWRAQVTKYVAGASTIASGAFDVQAPAFAVTTPSTWAWGRFRLSGSTLMYRAWQNGQAEPGTWLATFTDASIAAGGWVGLANAATVDVEFDFFGVALGGLSVPI